MLQKHDHLLSTMNVFDAYWKEEVEDSINGYSSLLEEVADAI